MSNAYDQNDGLPSHAGRLTRPESTYTNAPVLFGGGVPANDLWAIIAAATNGDVATIKTLADKNPDLVTANLNYDQPLHFSVRGNHVEAVRILLDRGANMLTESRLNGINQSLDWAKDRGNQEIYDLLDEDRRIKFNYNPEAKQVSDAIRKYCVDDVRSILEGDKSLAIASDETGNKPIHWAVLTGQMAIVDLLLTYGVDVDTRRYDGARPLDLIGGDYWYGHRDDAEKVNAPTQKALIAGYLVARGAAYDLPAAARFGDLGRIKELLASDPSLVHDDPTYVSWGVGAPLGYAAEQGREDIVKVLLEYGVDPNMREGNIAPRGSALYNAVGGRYMEIVKILLEHGADPNAVVESCGNVIGRAKDEIRELILSYGAYEDPDHGYSSFSDACRLGDTAAVREMIEEFPKLGSNQGELESAACAGQKEVVTVFMDMNPDLWQQVSIHRGEPELLRWMLNQGMNPNMMDWKGETPIHRAARRDEPGSLHVLLECGGRTDMIEGFDESTPLGLAAREGHDTTARILLDEGADPNLAGADWARPLAWAQRRAHWEIVNLLKENGV